AEIDRPAAPIQTILQIPVQLELQWDGSAKPSDQEQSGDWRDRLERAVNLALATDRDQLETSGKLDVALIARVLEDGKHADIDQPGHYRIQVTARRRGSMQATPSTESTRLRVLKLFVPSTEDGGPTLPSLEKAVAEHLMGEQRQLRASISQHASSSAARLREFNYHPTYSIVFSLMNEDSDALETSWDIKDALKAYVYPFLKDISAVSRFHVQSQVSYYSPLPIAPVAGDNGTYLTPNMLPHFVNLAEWNLASTDPVLPTIHFILFVPKPKSLPMRIGGQKGSEGPVNGFLVPQWGGVVIANPSVLSGGGRTKRRHHFGVKELRPVMQTFIAQLRLLLGVREVGSASDTLVFDRVTPSGISTLELDNLIRYRLTQNVNQAASTLVSLNKMVASLQSMVVQNHIRDLANLALERLDAVSEHLERGQLVEAFSSSVEASSLAERAFFDPNMVGMLYFPDEHKYAIYFPFLIPAAVPVISVVLHRLKEWKQARLGKNCRANPHPE
ncbi:GPI transamidase component, partial [Spiromyces aspiralis]